MRSTVQTSWHGYMEEDLTITSEEIFRKVSKACSSLQKGERLVKNDSQVLRVILDPSFPFPQNDTALWNSEDFLKMTYPTRGDQNPIGPVGMMCPEALRVILDPSFPFPQKDTALWNSEDFLKMTYPTRGVQNAIGPVGMMCPEALWVIFGSILPFFNFEGILPKKATWYSQLIHSVFFHRKQKPLLSFY